VLKAKKRMMLLNGDFTTKVIGLRKFLDGDRGISSVVEYGIPIASCGGKISTQNS
jgi:hypothetical protein